MYTRSIGISDYILLDLCNFSSVNVYLSSVNYVYFLLHAISLSDLKKLVNYLAPNL